MKILRRGAVTPRFAFGPCAGLAAPSRFADDNGGDQTTQTDAANARFRLPPPAEVNSRPRMKHRRDVPDLSGRTAVRPPSGQGWTTLDAWRGGISTLTVRHEPGLIGIGTVPQFAIGQRALWFAPKGNLLWDCIALIDEATVEIVKGLGGLIGIAISHPHYYSTMVEWSRALGGVRIHLPVRRRPAVGHASGSPSSGSGMAIRWRCPAD